MSYLLLLKTGYSEIRAWKQLSIDRQSFVSVHCEITRGRKKPNKDENAVKEYYIDKVFGYIENDFQKCKVCVVDITREKSLQSEATEKLAKSENGYEEWVKAVVNLNKKNSKVMPTLIINPNENEDFATFKQNIFNQFDAFSKTFKQISYRTSVLNDVNFIDDLIMLKDKVNEYTDNGNVFELLLDFEYINPSSANLLASFVNPIIIEIRGLIPKVRIVSLATSFPKIVTELGMDEADEFQLEELNLNREINRTSNQNVEYGDYGSINPIRNDNIIPVGVHLRARIDFPSDNESIFYHRVKPIIDKTTNKLLSPRINMYKNAAKRVMLDEKFSPLTDSWGSDQVVQAANHAPGGASPNFWISVRMEMHICRQIDRIRSSKSLDKLNVPLDASDFYE